MSSGSTRGSGRSVLENYIKGEITNCRVQGVVEGLINTGGIVGHSAYGRLKRCSFDGIVRLADPEILHEHYPELEDSGITGLNTGGIAGWASGDIWECYSTGEVSGHTLVGGIVGMNAGILFEEDYPITVKNSYSTSKVTGVNGVGGFAGNCISSKITDCYSAGAVDGEKNVGGFIGPYHDDTYYEAEIELPEMVSVIENCYWDTQSSGQATSFRGGTGLATEGMQKLTTYSEWDIVGVGNIDQRNTDYIWNIVDLQSRPFLSWQPGATAEEPVILNPTEAVIIITPEGSLYQRISVQRHLIGYYRDHINLKKSYVKKFGKLKGGK